MPANGHIPSTMLSGIPGTNAGLVRLAAFSYRAMHERSLAARGVSLHLIDGDIGRAYRSFARQVIARNFWCAQGKCGNAAVPGTSNHGLGLAVDLMTMAQRSSIDAVGRPFGWAKEWSDAPNEWWHLRWRDTGWRPRPDVTAKLPHHMRRAVRLLLHRRQERKREAATGKGPRWHRMDRAVARSYRRVEQLHRRAKDPENRRILRMALDDRDGAL
jgi:hypothetical protein